MSDSGGKANHIRSETSSPCCSDEMISFKKKSILLSSEYKRGSSKATIQWEESVKGHSLEERMKSDKRNRLHALGHLMSRGSKWSYIQEFMMKLKAEEGKLLKIPRSLSDEDSQGRGSPPKRIDSLSLARELWQGMLQKSSIKDVDLTLDQQAKLELLKIKVKSENDKYLKSHPELDILLSLVYRKLLKTKPDDPKLFVANYVHYLNAHREELVLDEVDVPFDREKVEEPDEEMVDERQEIEVFVRELVQKCAEIASNRSAVANVTHIIDSLLQSVDAQKEGSYSSTRSAEIAVRKIMMSMLGSVVRTRTRSAEIIAEEVMDSVFENVCPSSRRDSEDFSEMREGVESFIRRLLKTVTDKVERKLRLQDRLKEFEKSISREEDSTNGELDTFSITSKSILKKIVPLQSGESRRDNKLSDKPEIKSKVKFQSISLGESPSNATTLKEQ